LKDSDPFELSIVVVTYNSAHIVSECLAPLYPPREGLEIIVVDNHSADGTADLISQEFPGVRVIRMAANVGFARGVSAGVSQANGRVLCLLNPDAVARETDLAALAQQLNEDSGVGIIGPTVAHPDGRLRIVPMGAQPTIWRMFTHFSGLSRFAGLIPGLEGHYLLADQLTHRRNVGWIGGGCLLIRLDLWRSMGGMTDRWFMYAEDIELCHRVSLAGHAVIVDPTVEIKHRVGTSSTGVPSGNSAWVVNLFDFYATELAPSVVNALTWKVTVGLGLWSRAVAYGLASLRPGRGKWKTEARLYWRYGSDLFAQPLVRETGTLGRSS